jgi:hypothetical protein
MMPDAAQQANDFHILELTPSSVGDLCVLGSSLIAPDPHEVCCLVCWTLLDRIYHP